MFIQYREMEIDRRHQKHFTEQIDCSISVKTIKKNAVSGKWS